MTMNLPIEIIQAIFLELCSSKTIFPLRPAEPRLLVTRVCSQWRAVALSTPALWTNFYIHVWNSHQAPLLASIRAWIFRTAQSTLSFEFRSSADSFPLIADLVFPVAHRCSFLNLHLSTTTLGQLLMLPPNSLRTLQSITILVKIYPWVTGPTPLATAFQSCPELRTFSLMTIGRSGSRPAQLEIANFNVPWHQLTTLQLDSPLIPASECLDIIRRCTSLRECRISVSRMDSLARQRIRELSRQPAVLASLHTLRIGFPDSEYDNLMFLHALRLPHLRKFHPELPGFSEWAVDPAPWSLSVLQFVLCDTIQELNLSVFPFPERLSEILGQAPNLDTLWLNDDSHQYPEIMRGLGEGTIGPCLIALHFGWVESSDFVFDIAEARVVAAHANCDITAFVTVTTLDECDGSLNEARLLALTETGMEIRFGRDPLPVMVYP
ncbi:hypothetical protein BD779DRAFT_1676345 [Infundibulicybe gibba]|nr:hypothetical protein BD779DRAFT_1676345 [Infundibulicybe gibba]